MTMMSERGPSMRARWDRFAREDARFYIATSREDWNDDAFIESGRALVNDTMQWIGDRAGRNRLLEIGCGLGRTAIHFAEHFARVDAVDISPEMIRRANERPHPDNLHFCIGSGEDLADYPDASFDVIFSSIVMQHIPYEESVRMYIREVGRLLTVNGCAVLQFDTRPESLALKLYKSLPDALLPRVHRRGIRRYRRRVETLHEWFDEANLTIRDERGRRTAEHYFLLTPKDAAR